MIGGLTALLIGVALFLAGAGTAAAGAQQVPYLSKGEAARAIGRYLRRDFKHGAQRGSMNGVCFRKARNRVRCNLIFTALNGDCWEGDAWVRELRTRYRVTHRFNICDGTHD